MNVSKSHIILAGVILILGWFLLKSCDKQKTTSGLLNGVLDSLTVSKDKFGKETAKTSLLLGSVRDLKRINAGKDSTLRKLQQLVDRNTISATVLSNATGSNIRTRTDTIIFSDTVWTDSVIKLFPEYRTRFTNRWEDFNVVASRDSFDIKYTVFNEFEISNRWERPKWFKAKQAIVSVKNLNPNTTTKELKSFNIKAPKKRKGLIFVAGILSGIAAVKFINE